MDKKKQQPTSEAEKLEEKEKEKEKECMKIQPQNDEDEEEGASAVTTSTEPYGYCGLHNLGLTCYANSCLQMLYTPSRIRRYLIEHPQNGPFHGLLSSLFLRMETESSRLMKPTEPSIAIKPDKFLGQFRAAKSIFTAFTMHDAQEFIAILLESLHQEANQAKRLDQKKAPPPREEPKNAAEAWALHVRHVDNSYLSGLLMGQVESTLRCLTCSHISRSWTAIWQLQLQLESETETLSTAVFSKNEEKQKQESKVVTFKDCFKEYTEEETLNGDCAPFCSSCKSRQPTAKGQSICRAPHYLLVHLKRFAYDGTKIQCRVAIEERLQLCATHFIICSVVLHSGTETCGHYYTLHRERDNSWVQLDDQIITRGLTSNVVCDRLQRHAYLCLYKAVEGPKSANDKEKSASGGKPLAKISENETTKKLEQVKQDAAGGGMDKSGLPNQATEQKQPGSMKEAKEGDAHQATASEP